MKKVLLTKTQHIDRMPSAIVGSVVVDTGGNVGASESKKNSTSVIVSSKTMALPASVRVIPMPTGVITNAYRQRKSHQSVYEDLFKCLMRLPDKAVQDRVIDAINGFGKITDKTMLISNQNKRCSCEVSLPVISKVHASTQTENPNAEHFVVNKAEFPVKTEKTERKPTPTRDSGISNPIATSTPTPTTSTGKIPKKRGRKRNTCVPKVVMRSTAEMALQEREEKQLTPVTKKKKLVLSSTNLIKTRTSSGSPTPNLTERRNSSFSDVSFENINIDELSGNVTNYINKGIYETIVETMANECVKAKKKSDEGLLPIHDSILLSDLQGVQRQVYVFTKFFKIDLNDLITDDEEDCLQLAIQSDCDPKIMTTILKGGILPNHIYENSNTALHLAIINNIQVESLRELMNVIDINLLLQINDDGYTALHIAIRHNQYIIAEAILDSIDTRESNVVYSRAIDESNESQEDKVKKFSKYYEQSCEQLEMYQDKLKRSRLKRDVINASESRAGNPPLFYALEGEFEHLCYFLLAHLADPEEENLSGNSPKSFHYEYTRSLRLNLKVGRIMDKVTSILNTSQKCIS